MALDAPAVAYGSGSLPQANMAAARQHVQTLSARDREALLRALLEQYEQPQSHPRRSSSLQSQTSQASSSTTTSNTTHSSRSSSATTGSISALTSSFFDCPPLQEEAEEDLAVFSATDLQSGTTSAVASAISPTHPSRWTASPPSPTPSQHLRSQSMSVTTSQQPLRSSFSATQLQQPTNHGRSRSLSSTSDMPLPLQIPTKKESTSTSATTSSSSSPATTSKKSRPVLRIKTSAADFQDKEPASTIAPTGNKGHSYWCTACGEKLGDRTAWILHDVACRGEKNEKKNGGLAQRAWACGFCAAFLGSLERYQSHVAGHFERGRTLGHWHFANVIYGLLHQPAVHKPWKRLWAARAAALPSDLRPKATWSPGCCLLGREATEEPMTLQEALELFDASKDSASALALQADALAIYISVPIDPQAEAEAQKRHRKHSRAHKSDSTNTKTRGEASSATALAVASTTKSKSTTALVQRPESPPSPTDSTTHLLPPPAPISEPASAPSPVLHAQRKEKDAPLPALPSFTALQPPPLVQPLTMPSSSPIEGPKQDVKRGPKLSPRKPLFLFRSKSPSSSPEAVVEKEKVVPTVTAKETPARQTERKTTPPTAKLSKPRRVVSTPAMSATPSARTTTGTATTATKTRASTTATTTTRPTNTTTATASSSTTSAPRRNNWADRPLPPLIMDDFGIISNRAPTTTSSSAAAPIYTRMASGYATDQPPKPPPKPRAYTPADTMGDWNSIATTIVDDIMGPVNALHITV